MMIHIAEFSISRTREIGWSSQRVRLFGSLAGLPATQCAKLGKAVEAIARQIITARRAGTIQFALDHGVSGQSMHVIIRQPMGGLSPRAEPDDGVHLGTQLSLEEVRTFVDEVDTFVDTLGEAVRLVVGLPAGVQPIDPSVAALWATALATRSTQAALSISQRRITELTDNLNAAEQQGLGLRHELENLRQLHDTLELLALVASKTDNAVVILDSKCRVEWVNESFVRMTGYEMPEVRDQPLTVVLYGADPDSEGARELEATVAAGHGISQEIMQQRRDGRIYWASISITPVFDDEGQVNRWIGIASDATRQRHAQEALRQAKDQAEQASQTKSEFLANMSHEIRTPLNAVIGMAGLALDTNLNDEQREYLATILDSAESLLRLLNDILDLSKIESRKLFLEQVEFSLAETLRDVLKPFAFQARQQGVRLQLDLPLDLPERLVGDPTRLRQILSNLVGNAIKFTSAGRVSIGVKAMERGSEHAVLQFSVRDTGIGIPAEKQQQIFEAFTQADSSTTRRFGGSGLGLAISSQLVELMGGRIWVESEEGVGSNFCFEVRMNIGRPGPGFEVPIPPPGNGLAARRLSVLVTDDNRANRRLACEILQRRGHRIREAASGREVLQLLNEEQFDAILMDVQMPDMDGLETTAAIRQSEELDVQPYIVALTAHDMQGDRERCLAAGMDAYITKPLRARQLLALVDAVAQAPATDLAARGPGEASPSPGLDFSAALDRLEGDQELLVEQMSFYLEDSPILIRDIVSALELSDAKQLQMAAHRLRGLSAAFDAHDVVLLAAQCEEMGREANLEHASSLPRQLVLAWEHLCDAIRAYRSARR